MPEINRVPPSALRLYEIDAARAHEEVVDQIIYAIRNGLLQKGDRLPTIEELAESTGVSKPVVGEAVRVLREHDVVASKRGVQGGVTVITDDVPMELLPARGWRSAALTELVEARRPIETMLSLLAAERATEQDLNGMRETIKLLEDAALRPDASFLRFDHRFHYQVGRAARSEMLAFFQHRILSAIAVALHEYGLFHEDRDLVVNTHKELLAAIESRDPDRIRRATEHHFTTSDGSFASIEQLIAENGGA
ncbi:MAG: FadR family transcriptional regulator [Acidimicrobiia bacterium]|nr:FadR family transcriptional regulator [Acidimicrobiia bacterium]